MIDFINITSDGHPCSELVERLLRPDTTLWSSDPEVRRAIGNRLGWLDAAAFMDRHGPRIDDFAERARAEGYQQAVLLGMGGSSVAPEVYSELFGGARRSMALTVVDSTSPGYVTEVTERCETAATLFIVSSKSGTTAETSALDAHFFEWARGRFDRPQDRFIAITDAESPLQSLANERGYREIFVNPTDIGGRFSALSFFGLVPAALSGVELGALRARLPEPGAGSPEMADACRLGIALGGLALQGKNKLTLHLSPTLAPAGAWIEQLIDESCGKQGTGIVAVPNEPRFEPDGYSSDRFFVVVHQGPDPADEAWLDRLAGHGHPIARWRMDNLEQIGAEFYKWEVATALAGRELGINPFDEPDVNDSKAKTRALLEQAETAPAMRADSPTALAGLLAGARQGDYLAVLAYLPPTPSNRERLRNWCEKLGSETGRPCCPGFGPRYLHSSGQLHKGGPNQGIFIVVTRDEGTDVPIPGQGHGFQSLIRAQALGDLQVLKERGRRVVHFHLGEGNSSLDELIGAFP